MSRIEERLEVLGVDTSEMTTEEKFTAATGLTHYDEETAANDWYVPGGAANVPSTGSGSHDDEEVETYTAEEAAAYNLTIDGALQYGAIKTPAVEAVEAQPAIYSFESFDVDTDAPYGTGTVKVIEQDLQENVTTVEVLTNEPAGNTTAEEAAEFVGKQYFVHDTVLEANKHYNLYTGIQTPIYVTVELVSDAVEGVEAQDAVLYTNEEVDAYNAQLDGAVKAGDQKPNPSEIEVETEP